MTQVFDSWTVESQSSQSKYGEANFGTCHKCPHSPPQALTQSFGSSNPFQHKLFSALFFELRPKQNAQLKAILDVPNRANPLPPPDAIPSMPLPNPLHQ